MSAVQTLLTQFIQTLVPGNSVELGWWAIGGGFARAFGKQLDYDIQQSPWFTGADPFTRNFTKRLLDFTHHWWLGWILMEYISPTVPFTVELYWFGAGVLVDDLPDLVLRVKEMVGTVLKYTSEAWNNTEPDA